jgi:hypothetical protein
LSLNHSPSVVTNGLVYYHDMGNTQKSWKGAPTTTQTLVNHSLVTLPTFLDAPEKGAGWKKVIVTATSSNFRMLRMDSFTVAANSTTTYSIEFECSNPEVYLNIDGTGFGGGAWTKIGTTRYSRTVTTATAGSAYLFVNSNNLNASVNYIIYYKEHQIESGSFATPFVASARSNTQAIVDLTGTNTVTATSLTYASNNTFSFNGTSDRVISSTTNFNRTTGQELTVSCWLNPSRLSGQYQIICESRSENAATLNWAVYQHATDGAISFHGSAQNKSSYIPSIGAWVFVTNTVTTAGVSTLYVNGVSNSIVTGYTYGGTPSYFSIGANGNGTEPFLGSIPNVQIYNRALSAAEVLQNFNALRGRYGL